MQGNRQGHLELRTRPVFKVVVFACTLLLVGDDWQFGGRSLSLLPAPSSEEERPAPEEAPEATLALHCDSRTPSRSKDGLPFCRQAVAHAAEHHGTLARGSVVTLGCRTKEVRLRAPLRC